MWEEAEVEAGNKADCPTAPASRFMVSCSVVGAVIGLIKTNHGVHGVKNPAGLPVLSQRCFTSCPRGFFTPGLAGRSPSCMSCTGFLGGRCGRD